MNRRSFLNGATMAAASLPFRALTARAHDRDTRDTRGKGHHKPSEDYGPLFPTRDEATGLELIALPRGFEYTTFSWTGDPMESGQLTPGSHDGMAAFAAGRRRVRLVRNH